MHIPYLQYHHAFFYALTHSPTHTRIQATLFLIHYGKMNFDRITMLTSPQKLCTNGMKRPSIWLPISCIPILIQITSQHTSASVLMLIHHVTIHGLVLTHSPAHTSGYNLYNYKLIYKDPYNKSMIDKY